MQIRHLFTVFLTFSKSLKIKISKQDSVNFIDYINKNLIVAKEVKIIYYAAIKKKGTHFTITNAM